MNMGYLLPGYLFLGFFEVKVFETSVGDGLYWKEVSDILPGTLPYGSHCGVGCLYFGFQLVLQYLGGL